MIRRALREDSDAIAELYERSYGTLTFLPRLHTLDEHKASMGRHVAVDDVWVWDGLCTIAFGDGTGNEERVPDVQYAWRPTLT